MKIVIAANPDGEILKMYDSIEPCDYLITIGNFGIWPDPQHVDKATRTRGSAGDFSKLYLDQWVAPIKTLVIPGYHEDHRWLRQRILANNLEILPNVSILINGFCTNISQTDTPFLVLGLGKGYSKNTFSGKFHRKSLRHYTRKEVEQACSAGKVDLFCTYNHPSSPGISNIMFATRPTTTIFYDKSGTQPSKKKTIALAPKQYHVINVK